MTEHSKLGASGSAKWLSCAPALAMEHLFAEPEEDKGYALEGTAAHWVGSECLEKDRKPEKYLGELIEVKKDDGTFTQLKCTQEMVDAVEIYVNYIKGLQGKAEFFEVKVDYTHIAPDGFGTADAVVETVEKIEGKPSNTMYIVDLKYGKGIRVGAFENPQGMLYALGALNSLDVMFDKPIERVVIVIVQPRVDSVSEFEISVEDLLKWGQDYAAPRAEKAHAYLRRAEQEKGLGDAPAIETTEFNPTEKGCQWCKVKVTCKARAKTGYEASIKGFSDLTEEKQNDLPSIKVSKSTQHIPYLMSNDDLSAAYYSMGIFETWTKTLKVEILKRLMDGQDVPGLKPVATQGNRSWKFEENAEIIKALRTAGFKKKDYEVINVISPTVAEKVLKGIRPKDHAKRFKKLTEAAIHRPAGKNTVARENDKRESVALSGFTGPRGIASYPVTGMGGDIPVDTPIRPKRKNEGMEFLN